MSLFACTPLPPMSLFVTNFGYPLPPLLQVTSFLNDLYHLLKISCHYWLSIHTSNTFFLNTILMSPEHLFQGLLY